MAWTLMALGSIGFAAYLCLRLRQLHQFHDAVSVWSAWIFKGYLFFAPFRHLPLAAGVALGLLQFLPETSQRRIRLALHLPLGEERVITHHLLVGLLLLTGLIAPAIVLFAMTGWRYFPLEFQRNLALTLAPWFLAGYAGYLLTATVLLESAWRYRLFHLLLGGAALRLFFLGEFYDVYQRILPGLTLWTCALFVLPLLSAYRFRKGL
ncbi:MAG: hypothetical protein RMN51_05630 [Verrucomicrobiota bacterium]|nr:hypothetical protein [Limisphaera sp.]MDW8381571.1 hypothetical protein [Verrucomicrobiota bacterium]